MNNRLSVSLLIFGCLSGHPAIAEPFTAEHLVRLDRVGAPNVSPDSIHVVYTLRTTDMEADKGRYDLWLSKIDGGDPKQLTHHEANDTAPAWSPDGKHVFFLSTRSDSSQLWRIAVSGGEATQVTDFPVDIETFRVSANGDRLVVSAQAYLDCDDLACTAARDKAEEDSPTTGAVYDQIFMRHWDHWLTEKRSRLFAVPLKDGIASTNEPLLLTKAVNANVPSYTWGGNEEYALSPDGSTVYFVARIRDATEPTSTNFDIYSAPMNGDGPTENLSKSNLAWDAQPILSPDGSSLAYLAMSRAGFEADRFRIIIRDLASGKTRELAKNWDRSPASIIFSSDGKSIYANAQDVGNKTLWRIDVASGDPEKIIEDGNISAMDVAGDAIVFAKDDLKSPSELFVFDGATTTQITHFSEAQLHNIEMGDFEQFSFTGAKGEEVHGYVLKPANYVEGKQYPVAFLIHGGPQSSFGNHFHYRWNPQTYAGQGFAAVFIDFHGSTGYGQDFTDSISENWGGDPLVDLQLGFEAALEKYSFLDGENTCALGASYGGFMINWIAGNWPDRFDCLVNHDGIFDQRMMYYTTEELWFLEWENGGPYYENAENFEKYNPVSHVEKWQTPMFIIHGQLDYRVPLTQGIAAFTALQRRGIPSKFLHFPDENHWIQRPHNSVQWHKEVNKWLHQYLD